MRSGTSKNPLHQNLLPGTLSATSTVHTTRTRTRQQGTSCNTFGPAESRCLRRSHSRKPYFWLAHAQTLIDFSSGQDYEVCDRANRWGLIELTYDDQGGFSVENFDFVLVYPSRTLDLFNSFNLVTSDGKVVFQFRELTLVWDYAQNSCAGWTLGGVTNNTEVSALL